jgi:hypothetical protein
MYVLVTCSIALADDKKVQKLSNQDYTALKVCEGVIQLFKQFPDSVWTGYNLAEKPFVVYMPGKWALLFNYSRNVDGFAAYPKDWPDLETKVLFHPGQYQDLAGQLASGYRIDTISVTAVGFNDQPAVDFFGFVVHENFHEYQLYGKHPAFGEITWEREEKYPIQDRENTALAYLEMRLLMDALMMMEAGHQEKCREYVKQFVAVRNRRWKQGNAFVAKYEQGKELQEGTARYVEIKSIVLMSKLKYKSAFAGLTSAVREDFASISMPEYILHDFQGRITENSISPEDMPRNRIYPVGAALGFLLDYFKIDWTKKAQAAGPQFSFAQFFKDNFQIDENELELLVKKAKDNYNYEEILASTDRLIQEYLADFNRELEIFEAQAGYRIEISLSSRSLSRSRSSTAKKWLVDQGTGEFNSHYNIYALKNEALILQVKDAGVYEQNHWEEGRKKVVFFVPEISSVSLDDNPFKVVEGAQAGFKKIGFTGKNLKLSYSKPGSISVSGRHLNINLIQ